MDKEILYRFFNNESSVEEQTRILDWLDESPEHNKEMLAERKMFDAMILLADEKALSHKPSPFWMPRWAKEVVRYAAVILVMLGAGGYYVSHWKQELLQATNTISVPAGQRVDIVLPDGTKVCVNALSELQYPAFFAGDSRKVKLTGEAFFDVIHDAAHPFIVETYACDVEVLGTKFDVEARPQSNKFTASLVEGKVKVTDHADPFRGVVLHPNERVEYINNRFVVGRIPEYEGFQWREGLIAFRDATFMELIGEFEKYYGVQIEVRRTSISHSIFTGKIRISEGVDHALWVLQQSAVFSYTRNDTKEIIYIQ
ncbi:MAG: FecR domain-containing protein [Alistipes sp.]